MKRLINGLKRLSAVAATAALIAAGLPSVCAEEAAGKLERPSNVILKDKSNSTVSYLYNFTLGISYDKDSALSEFVKNGEYKKAVAQVDWSIDSENNWIYNEFKDKWDTISSDNSKIWDYSGCDGDESARLTADKTQERDILKLYHAADKEWSESGLKERVAAYTYTLKDAYITDVPLIDLKHHTIYVRVRYAVETNKGEFMLSDWSDTAAIGKDEKPFDNSGNDNPNKNDEPKIDVSWTGVSDWAADSVKAAAELGLYPKVLDKENLTRSINRREFAGIVVSLLNGLGLETTLPAENPFSDTRDINVLKAYNAGIMLGKSPDMFIPMEAITREETAVILDRVYKAAYKSGVMKELSAVKDVKFSDDGDISVWAKDAVYEMASAGIIEGVGGGNFAPKNITAEQVRAGYANTSIEQALALSLRLYRLKK